MTTPSDAPMGRNAPVRTPWAESLIDCQSRSVFMAGRRGKICSRARITTKLKTVTAGIQTPLSKPRARHHQLTPMNDAMYAGYVR